MVNTRFTLLDPTLEKSPKFFTLAPRRKSISGSVAGILYNGKPNSRELLTEIYELLRLRFDLRGVVTHNGHSVAHPADKNLIDDLVARCDFVLVGVGD
jgi:hypothetical protein